MKKDKVTMFAEESYNDLDDNIGIVMPILTDCDVDEDFTEGMEKVGEELPILPLRNMVLFPGVAMPVMIGRPKSMRLIKEAAHKKSLIGVVCQNEYGRSEDRRFVCDGSCGRYCPRARNARRNDNRDPAR